MKRIDPKMKKISAKILFLFLLFLLIGGCSSNKVLVKSAATEEEYNKEAMRHVIQGAIYDLLGQPKDALVKYHQASEIDSSSAGIMLAMAEDYFVIDEIPTSIRLAQKALRKDPHDPAALELLGMAYEQTREYKKAVAVYETMTELEPDNIDALYRLISIQLLTRQNNKALDTYRKIAQTGFDDADFLLRLGHIFLRYQAFSQALEIYNDVSRANPKNESAYLAIAAIHKAKGDTAAAMQTYYQALEQNVHFEDVKAELRVILQKQKMWDQAIALYDKFVQKDPNNINDKLQLGQFYFSSGDTLRAYQTFDQAVKEYPKSEKPYLAKAMLQQIIGDTLDAETTYLAALAENRNFYDSRRRLRDIYVDRKAWDKAIELYESLMDNDTTYVGSRIEIANLLLQKGDTLEAIQRCESLLQTHGDDWRVPVTLGRYYFLSENNEKAADHLDRAVQLREDIPGLWLLRGVNFLRMDSLDSALDNFQNSLKTFPDDPELNYYLGMILSRKKKYVEAIKYLSKTLEKEPDNTQALLAVAAAYDEIHQYDRSEKIYDRLYQATPDSPLILNNYAYHLSVRGIRLTEALEMSEKALQAEPDNAAYLDTMGWIYFQIGDYSRAVHFVSKSLDSRSNSPEVLEHLGDIHSKMGDKVLAEEYWRKALEFDKQDKTILDKLGQSSQ
ncbi:hypothetical protein A2V82_04310 [candidate division KSB1 bacterium RBG_16_48_16]|nr:MAG: hypothetical protein A2V82_04310 [candidate division KSB1 bacterium RBG_16_48_16]